MCELAYTSFNKNAKIFRGLVGKKAFHPTEKPKALYRWILENYANYNAMMGALECCKQEYYRTLVGLYEDKKIDENGDV